MITVHIPEHFFSTEEQVRLMDTLGIESEDQWVTALQKLTLSALSEMKQMLLGDGLPTRADEIMIHRLYHLIEHYFVDHIPSEAQVSAMFQFTSGKSKSLLRNTLTRFNYYLRHHRLNTLAELLESGEQDAFGNYILTIHSDTLVDELNFIISQEAPTLDPLKKQPNTARNYKVTGDSFAILVNHVNAKVGSEAAAGIEN